MWRVFNYWFCSPPDALAPTPVEPVTVPPGQPPTRSGANVRENASPAEPDGVGWQLLRIGPYPMPWMIAFPLSFSALAW